ncbi:MAG: phosphatase PAP2 family protein [Patescibacteria group bacterium]
MSDIGIVQFIQGIFLSSLTGQWISIALARVWIFLFIPLVYWVWLHGSSHEKHGVKELLWSAALAVFSSELLALFIMRPRPFLAAANIITLIPAPLTSAFPSIHTSVAIACSIVLWSVNRWAGYIGFLITLGVIIGRISAGVHYPTDIIGGIIIGLLSFTLVRLGHKAQRHPSSKIS